MRNEAWDQNLQDLSEYVRVNGRVPTKNSRVVEEPEQVRLANFAASQRRKRKSGGLTPDQEAALEAIPGFLWLPRPDAWSANVQDFGDFFIKHGRVPNLPSQDAREARLGAWANEQRGLRREWNKREAPPAERQAQLEAMPGWEWEPLAQARRARLDEFAAFVAREGRVPRQLKAAPGVDLTPAQVKESALATWLSNQRLNDRKGKLDSEQKSHIERILGRPLNP